MIEPWSEIGRCLDRFMLRECAKNLEAAGYQLTGSGAALACRPLRPLERGLDSEQSQQCAQDLAVAVWRPPFGDLSFVDSDPQGPGWSRSLRLASRQ